MKRLVSLTLAVVMSLSLVNTAFAANFKDINDVPWEGAKQYINKVSDLGLMVGDKDSNGNQVFRAKDRITYCEAMQLAYSILDKTDALKTKVDSTTKWSSTMQGANIPTWAFKAVSYGLESGVLSANDIKIFMKEPGVNREATRENVAVIFGKAFSHISPVDKSANLDFNDKNEITDSSIPYIELLARLNIIVGDENKNFNPKNYINRAEMAVISSKSYDKVKEIKAAPITPTTPTVNNVKGTVILTDDGKNEKTIALSSSATGNTTNYTINSATPVIAEDGSQKTYEDISVGDTITITTSNGTVVSVVINSDKKDSKDETPSNKVKEGYLNNISRSFIAFDTKDGKQTRYEIVNNPRITLNDAYATIDDLYDYVVDRNIIYVTVKLNDSGLVESISAKFPNVEGELTKVEDGKFYIDYEYSGRSKVIKVDAKSSCEIYLDGQKTTVGKLESMFEDGEGKGLYAHVTNDKFNEADKIEIFHDTYKNGKLVDIDSNEITMISSFGKEVTYECADDAKFYLNGSEVSYKDIRNAAKESDVKISIEFNSHDEVINVKAEAKALKGVLSLVDDKRLAIVDKLDTRISVEVDRNIECTCDGEYIAYSNLKKKFRDTKNKYIAEIELDDNGKAVKIDVTEGSDTEGKVIDIEGKKITIEDITKEEHTYNIEPAVKYFYNDDEIRDYSEALKYIRKDDATVKLTFSSRGYVNRIYIVNDK